ncbi:hypothetical protein QN277_005642 [Acacia crassicarpa]|uniref:Uncharacterized protein n=1 Tax=Acacia crassicarpa TaxID=499986 RepID=A0AAE1MA05_9FABA|nr:hypothetical protein QN277_005642 [Acacia crassicarpa]
MLLREKVWKRNTVFGIPTWLAKRRVNRRSFLHFLVLHLLQQGHPVYFIEPHHPNKFFWRGTFYGSFILGSLCP